MTACLQEGGHLRWTFLQRNSFRLQLFCPPPPSSLSQQQYDEQATSVMNNSNSRRQQQHNQRRCSYPTMIDSRTSVALSGDDQSHHVAALQPQHVQYQCPNNEEGIFEFFYQVIFSLVHTTLSFVLSPLMKHKPKAGSSRSNMVHQAVSTSQPRSSRRSSSSAIPSTSHAPRRVNPIVTIERDTQQYANDYDPEAAMGGVEDDTASMKPSYSPSALRRNNSNTDKKRSSGTSRKAVHFPVEKRRPPLGRIGVNPTTSRCSVLSESSASTATTPSSVSICSSRSNVKRSSYMQSAFGRHPLDRIRMSATGSSPRTHHSTYFLSD